MKYKYNILIICLLALIIALPSFSYAETSTFVTMGKTEISPVEAWNILATSSKSAKWYLLTGADSVYMLGDTVMVIHTEQNETIALSLKKTKGKVTEEKFDGGLDSGESKSTSDDDEATPEIFWMKRFGYKPVLGLSYCVDCINIGDAAEAQLKQAKQAEQAGLLDNAERYYNYAGDKESWLEIRKRQLNQYIYSDNWDSAADAAFDIGQEEMAKELAQKAGEQYEAVDWFETAMANYIKAGNMHKAKEMEDLITR